MIFDRKNAYFLTLIVLAVLGLALTAGADAADSPQTDTAKRFNGFYGGVEAGKQTIFGGSSIAGADILQKDTRPVASAFLGWRKQFDAGLVVGMEGQLGITDGNLALSDTNLDIQYRNNSQSAFGLTLGMVFGEHKNWLVFAYGFETSRTFDVTINSGNVVTNQRDNQGMIRYGLGLEHQFRNGLGIRILAGSLRADFGDRPTNIGVQGNLDLMAGILYQF